MILLSQNGFAEMENAKDVALHKTNLKQAIILDARRKVQDIFRVTFSVYALPAI